MTDPHKPLSDALGAGATPGPWQELVARLLAERYQLAAEVEALRVDAERWRAMRTADGGVTLRIHNSRGDQRDSIIDSARKE